MLTRVSQTEKMVLFRGYSYRRRGHRVFEIFPKVKNSIQAKQSRQHQLCGTEDRETLRKHFNPASTI